MTTELRSSLRKLRQGIIANLDDNLNPIDVELDIRLSRELDNLKSRFEIDDSARKRTSDMLLRLYD